MRKNHKGFSIVEILIVIVVVGLLGTVGWLVYERQKSKTDGKETTPTKQQIQKQETAKPEETKKDELTFFDIKELGVKFELSKAPKGLYYHIGNNNRTAYFSLEEFKGTDCAADKTAQVALTRYTEREVAEDPFVANRKEDAKKIGDNYYFSVGGQSACSEVESVQEKASKLRSEITQLLPAALVQIQ